MNGAPHLSPNVVDIHLRRGAKGLGFNIVGGVDQPYVVNDNGIFVSKIKQDGEAAMDGRLQEGDKILAINGIMLADRKHNEAVDLFRTSGEHVELRVLKKLPVHMNGSAESQPHFEPSVSSRGLLAALVGATAIVAFIYLRHLRKMA